MESGIRYRPGRHPMAKVVIPSIEIVIYIKQCFKCTCNVLSEWSNSGSIHILRRPRVLRGIYWDVFSIRNQQTSSHAIGLSLLNKLHDIIQLSNVALNTSLAFRVIFLTPCLYSSVIVECKFHLTYLHRKVISSWQIRNKSSENR